jgi:hypothetical protein
MRQPSRQPDGGPVGRIKGLLSRNIYSIGELDNSSKLNRENGKRQLARDKHHG